MVLPGVGVWPKKNPLNLHGALPRQFYQNQPCMHDLNVIVTVTSYVNM